MIPWWRFEELELAQFLGVPSAETENMTCSDFADAQEYMHIQLSRGIFGGLKPHAYSR